MTADPFAGRSRAVSTTVAFVLVFSLVVTSVGLVATLGFDSLRDVSRAQQTETAAGAIRTVGGGIDDVARGERPGYGDSVDLGSGGVSVTNRTSITVEVAGTGFDETYRPRALGYANDGRNTTYVSGVLARGGDRSRGVLLRPPGAVRCSAGEVAAVTVVELVPEGGRAVGGGTVAVEARRLASPPPNVTYHRPPTTLTVDVDGPWAAAWDEALADQGFTDAGGAFTCDARRVVVRLVRVEVELVV